MSSLIHYAASPCKARSYLQIPLWTRPPPEPPPTTPAGRNRSRAGLGRAGRGAAGGSASPAPRASPLSPGACASYRPERVFPRLLLVLLKRLAFLHNHPSTNQAHPKILVCGISKNGTLDRGDGSDPSDPGSRAPSSMKRHPNNLPLNNEPRPTGPQGHQGRRAPVTRAGEGRSGGKWARLDTGQENTARARRPGTRGVCVRTPLARASGVQAGHTQVRVRSVLADRFQGDTQSLRWTRTRATRSGCRTADPPQRALPPAGLGSRHDKARPSCCEVPGGPPGRAVSGKEGRGHPGSGTETEMGGSPPPCVLSCPPPGVNPAPAVLDNDDKAGSPREEVGCGRAETRAHSRACRWGQAGV